MHQMNGHWLDGVPQRRDINFFFNSKVWAATNWICQIHTVQIANNCRIGSKEFIYCCSQKFMPITLFKMKKEIVKSISCPIHVVSWYQIWQQIIFKRKEESLASSLLNIICRQNWYQCKSDYVMDREFASTEPTIFMNMWSYFLGDSQKIFLLLGR